MWFLEGDDNSKSGDLVALWKERRHLLSGKFEFEFEVVFLKVVFGEGVLRRVRRSEM